jgi:hypothetical protein
VLFIVFKTLNLKQSEFLRFFYLGYSGPLDEDWRASRGCMLQRDMLYACHLIPVLFQGGECVYLYMLAVLPFPKSPSSTMLFSYKEAIQIVRHRVIYV